MCHSRQTCHSRVGGNLDPEGDIKIVIEYYLEDYEVSY